MQVSYVLLIIGFVLLSGFAFLQIGLAVILWLFVRDRVIPIGRLSTMELEVQALSQAVTKLRTQKAGRASRQKREEAQAQAEEEDPDLAGLTPEERVLFTGFPTVETDPS